MADNVYKLVEIVGTSSELFAKAARGDVHETRRVAEEKDVGFVGFAGGVGSVGCDATASAAAIALSRQDGLATIRVIATLPDGYELHRLIRVSGPAGGDDPAGAGPSWRARGPSG